jgi:hypothetical protein
MLISRGGANTPAVKTAVAELYRYHGLIDQAISLLAPLEKTNHSRYFVLSSLLCIDKAVGTNENNTRQKLPPIRKAFENRISFSCSSLAFYGRFGHTLTEYVFLKDLASKNNAVFATSDWVGSRIFELDDPIVSVFGRRVTKTSTEILEDLNLYGSAALDGFDFFSPGGSPTWMPEQYHFARSVLKFRPHIKEWCDSQLKLLAIDVDNLIAVHVRLTDYIGLMRLVDSSAYMNRLEIALRGNPRAKIFLMSDDIDAAENYLGHGDFVTLPPLPAESFALRWLLDFYVLTIANVCLISQSAFSYWGTILNRQAHLEAWRPDIDTNSLVRFSPEKMDCTPHKL